MDADGDGFTNGQELGDADGDSRTDTGVTTPTRPADRNSFPVVVLPPGTYFTEGFDTTDTAGLTTKGWNIGKNDTATETGTEFVVAPPYALATEDNPAEPGTDFSDADGNKFLFPPTADGTQSKGKYLISDSDTAGGSDDIDSKAEFWAITPSFSTVGSTEAWFHADAEIENNNNGECVVELAASIDGGTTWIPMWATVEPQRPEKSLAKYGDVPTGGQRTGGYPEFGSASQTKSWSGIHGRWHVKLPAEANNKPNVKIRIEYFEPADAWWIALDNVLVDNTPPPQGKNTVFAEQFEKGIPATWKLGNKKGQNWGTEGLKGADGKFLLLQTENEVPVPVNVDIVREAASRGIAKADILDPAKNQSFDVLNPNGGSLDGRFIMMLAGGNYALWQEGLDPEELGTLDTPPIDLTGATNVFLDFDSEWLLRHSGVTYDVFVSTDNGQTFSRVSTYQGALMNRGESSYFMHHYLPVPAAAGKKDVVFRFQAGGGGDADQYQGFWVIDNVRVSTDSSVAPPAGSEIKIASIAANGASLTLNWTGGTGPFLVEKKSSLSDAAWMKVLTTAERTATVLNDGGVGFFRISGGASGQVVQLTALLSGAAEVPAVNTPAAGGATLSLEGNNLTYSVRYEGLTSNASAAHIHAPATTDKSTGVMQGMTAPTGTSGVISGTMALTDAQKADVLAGRSYINIHTASNGGGEIRGQIIPAQFKATLSGAAEVPAVNTTATGSGVLNVVGNYVTYSITYNGLSSNASAAHLHAPADETKSTGVMQGLVAPTGTSGTMTGSMILTPEQLNFLMDGLVYINIHTANNGGGELRGQVKP